MKLRTIIIALCYKLTVPLALHILYRGIGTTLATSAIAGPIIYPKRVVVVTRGRGTQKGR